MESRRNSPHVALNVLARPLVVAALVVLLLGHGGPLSALAQQPASSAPTSDELKAYETFRAWVGSQPPEVQQADDALVFQRYAALLQSQGQSAQQAASTIDLLRRLGDRAEIERWNRILTAPSPAFNTSPNAFLVAMTAGVKPGRSLDVGMGQGRNTIYLAQQGWNSAGFDPADRAVAAAQETAKALGAKITATVARDVDFDWGESQWDLIVLSYVGAREYVDKVTRALRPGGMVVVEAFHRDATKAGPIGSAVVFDTNELLRLFAAFRVVRYEDADAVGDFGQRASRVVRLAAVKP
jgi:SAM-dependent methyltransferase